MALPQAIGQATVWAVGKGEKEFKPNFTKSGQTVLNINLSFQKARKDDYGEWVTEGQLYVRATAWGEIADFVMENISHGDQVNVTLTDLHLAEFEKADGTTGQSLQATIQSVSGSIKRRTQSNDGY